MPRTCTVCRHASRPDIEKAIVCGDSFRDIARQFDVSKDAVRRHKADHLPKTLGKALEAGEAARAYGLLSKMLGHEVNDNPDKQAAPVGSPIVEGRRASDAISDGEASTDTKGTASGAMLLPKAARDERQRIIQAFQRLGVPRETWCLLVGPEPIVRHGGRAPGEPFWPPIYNPYEQTPDEWRRLVHVELEEYLDELLKSCQVCVNIGLGEPVELPKQRRNRTASINERYEWAALRLMGHQWIEIGSRYRDCSTAVDIDRALAAVRKTATDILRRARLKPTGNKKPSS